MTVASVEAIPVAYPEPNDAGAERHLCLVRVRDTDGREGWGEAVTMWPEASRATVELVAGMAELVVGRDPVEAEEVWEDLREHAWWYGGAGIASFALSAIDIALWDLKGKALGRSLLELLGGAARESLPAIASGHATNPSLQAMADEVAGWVDGAAQGAKIGFGKRGEANLGFDRARDIEFVRLTRAALGPEALLMIDLGVRNRWTVPEAIDRIHAFEEYDLHWIEEPLGADNPEGYAELRARTSTPIAYGEREWSVRGLQRVIESGTCDVVGIDPGRAEGITGFARASELAEAAGITTNAHSWSSAIVLAASLALSWAMPSGRVFETKPLRNPMQHDLAAHTPAPSDGWWPQPDGPGLGIEVDESVVEHYRMDR